MTHDPRLEEVAGRYADGGATADDVRALEEALRSDPSFRRWFLRYLNVDAALGSAVFASAGGTAVDRPAGAAAGSRFIGRPAWWAAAAAAIVLVVLGVWRPRGRGGGPAVPDDGLVTAPAAPVVPSPPVVVLVAATHARWADADVELALRSGDLPGGLLRLEAGSAEFRFADGATAVLLGPAAVRFPRPRQMVVQEGRALCRCPTPQSRITVTTPATQVVDLGTEFAVDVAPDGPSTRVAVVSGEVRVGSAQSRVLRTGEAAEVGPDHVVRLAPLPADTLAELLAADPSRSGGTALGPNLLADLGFAAGGKGPWRATEGHVDLNAAGGGAAVVHARGHRFWPGVRQTVATGDVAGRLVVASVEGTSQPVDPLGERQSAILKVLFVDAQGREFATASRHFLQATDPPATPVAGRVAAFAPPGTHKVQFQLLLNARGRATGTVRFAAPSLVVGAPPGETTRPH